MEIAAPALGLGIAYALIEVLKMAISKIRTNGNGSSSAKTLARIDARTHELWEAHKPVDGRYQWWFPHDFSKKQDKMIENQGAMLTELRTISGHLKAISNGTKGTTG